ncbi:MAG TPA: hypothetical protein VKY42_02980, partial [Trueperaceae bacterium]|nr:hypothetical protein [Trueperaceae bacterium]
MMRRVAMMVGLALALSWVAALDLPTDATVMVTSPDGTIVGVGRVVAGRGFVLELLPGFSGEGTLVFTTPDGDVRVAKVSVRDGAVFV